MKYIFLFLVAAAAVVNSQYNQPIKANCLIRRLKECAETWETCRDKPDSDTAYSVYTFNVVQLKCLQVAAHRNCVPTKNWFLEYNDCMNCGGWYCNGYYGRK
uniref:Uncharacterized protein LOC114348592 n=1 Tax=Diabrotica virgifera virgifera TaxID=50390 RepID=A0A6P7H8L7_DIAVI